MDRLRRRVENFVLLYNGLRNRVRRRVRPRGVEELLNMVTIFRQLGEERENEGIIRDIVASMERVNLFNNDIVLRTGDVGNCMYFLRRGSVDVVINGGHVVATLEAPSYFGEISIFLKDQRRTATVIAKRRCEIHVFSRRDFRKILRRYPLAKGTVMEETRRRFDELRRMRERRQ